MSTESKSIHEFDFSLICEYFSGLERQGPGSPETTLQALKYIKGLNKKSRIADIGCGTGSHTMVMAKHTPGQITSLDLFPDFIQRFNDNAKQHGLEQRVRGITGSMEEPPFTTEELDMIWSEGAIYNIGFEQGIIEWRKFLKPGGYIAVTDASWFTTSRPREIEDFWVKEYPGIDLISVRASQMEKSGYKVVATFILPDYCWTDNYYVPQIARQEEFLKKYAGNKAVLEFVNWQRHEAKLYDKYRKHYGYVFFIGKKL